MTRIPTFVVSLPGDEDRLARLQHQLDSTHFDVRPPVGFLGRMLPDIVCLRLTHDPNSVNNKGALGVMMSHIGIWERVAQLDAPFALVLEDDVDVNNIGRLAETPLPRDFDIIFCGDQSARIPVDASLTSRITFAPAIQVVPLVNGHGAIGAYGYLLSPAGAANLLHYFSEHLYFGHVDVRMLAYCCSLNALNGVDATGRLIAELRDVRHIVGDPPPLSGFATMQPLVTHVGMASRREREDTLGLTHGTIDA